VIILDEGGLMKNSQCKKVKNKKGMTQIDYIIAAGIFIMMFAIIVQFVLTYFSTVSESSKTVDLNSEGRSLLLSVDNEYIPDGWPEINQNTETGLVLLMHLNNESRYGENRTFFKDFSNQGNNGSCTNCPYHTQNGKLGGAIVFDGSKYIDAGNVQFLSSGGTMEGWFKFQKDTGELEMLQYWNGSAERSFELYRLSTGLGVNCAYYNGTIFGATDSINVTEGTWYHYACVWNGTNIKTYRDGILRATSSSFSFNTFNPNKFYIGTYNGGTNSFNGTIDEVAIYNRSLSASEIMLHYNYGLRLRHIGLKTKAYRFLILVNNTQSYYYNQSMSVTALTNELVSFNYTKLGFPKMDYKSTVVYNETNDMVPYQIVGDNITFRTDIASSQSKWFEVYFDDDSTFEDRSTTITGTNNLTETIYPVEKIEILQYRKMIDLNNTNYTAVKNLSSVDNDFRARVLDTNTSTFFLTYGETPPSHTNIIAFQRFMLFQNSTAGIRGGKFIIQIW
jgi:hypothetical protein